MGAYLAKIKDISSYYKDISSASLLYPVCVCVSTLTLSFVVAPGTLAAVQSLGVLQDITIIIALMEALLILLRCFRRRFRGGWRGGGVCGAEGVVGGAFVTVLCVLVCCSVTA